MSLPIKNMISIPRSGQHMTESALSYYYNLMNMEFLYCEYYNCCQSRPCKKNQLAYHKNHDTDIMWSNGIEINDKDKYLFLFRKNILQQIEAHFRLDFALKNISNCSNKLDYNDEKMVKLFKDFFQSFAPYYKKIYKKYLNIQKTNVLQIEYDHFVLNFNDTFRRILQFFDVPIHEEFIEKTKLHIKPRLVHKINKNDSYYKKLDKYIHDELNK